jgi:molecular chaperone HscB
MISDAPFALRLDASDFELFDVPARFAQDRATLDARWRGLMAGVHPDRFAAGSPAEQCAAMQWAIRFNQAYERLKQPLARASYLCELNGQRVDAETNTAMPPSFLVRMMDWREALDRARGAVAVQALADEAEACRRDLLAEVAGLIDDAGDWAAAAARVRALMFVARFAQEVERRAETFDGLDG